MVKNLFIITVFGSLCSCFFRDFVQNVRELADFDPFWPPKRVHFGQPGLNGITSIKESTTSHASTDFPCGLQGAADPRNFGGRTWNFGVIAFCPKLFEEIWQGLFLGFFKGADSKNAHKVKSTACMIYLADPEKDVNTPQFPSSTAVFAEFIS